MKNRQNGSTHIVVIIVLIIALFATLGVIFYQNFIAKKTVEPTVAHPTQPADTTKTIRTAFGGTIYALDYPRDWVVKTSQGEGSTDDSTATTLTSPSQKVQVTFNVTSGGLGGSCDPNDGLKISDYTVYPTSITKLTTQPLNVVETIYDAAGGGYSYLIGLTPDGGATHSAIGDSHCNIMYVGVASTLVLNGSKVMSPTIIAQIKFPKLTKDGVPVSEMQPVKDLLKTSDYKAAVKILESARKE